MQETRAALTKRLMNELIGKLIFKKVGEYCNSVSCRERFFHLLRKLVH